MAKDFESVELELPLLEKMELLLEIKEGQQRQLDFMQRNKDLLALVRSELVDDWLHHPPQGAGQFIKDYITNKFLINKKRLLICLNCLHNLSNFKIYI